MKFAVTTCLCGRVSLAFSTCALKGLVLSRKIYLRLKRKKEFAEPSKCSARAGHRRVSKHGECGTPLRPGTLAHGKASTGAGTLYDERRAQIGQRAVGGGGAGRTCALLVGTRDARRRSPLNPAPFWEAGGRTAGGRRATVGQQRGAGENVYYFS